MSMLPPLVGELRIKASQAQQALKDTADASGHMAKTTSDNADKAGGAFKGAAKAAIGLAAPIAALAGGAGIARFGTESVQVFSGLEDAMGAASVVFGDSMKIITAQADGASKTLGMTKTQVIDAANTFGTFGKSAGLAGGDLAHFSTDMTKLAGDMASFKGKTPEEAIQAIGSALRGESEPIRSFGVLLDDATLKNRALSMGLISTTKDALTPQIKVLAAQKEILAQTKDAQGDFARTQDSTANVSKRLSAETENLKAKVGSFLAPAFTQARLSSLGFIETISGFVDKVGPGFTATMERVGDVVGKVKAMFKGGDFTGALPAEFRELIPAVMTLISAFSPLGLVLKALAPVLPELADAAGQLAGQLAGVLASAMEILAPIISTIITGIAGAVSWFTDLEGSGQALAVGLGVLIGGFTAYHVIVGTVTAVTKGWAAIQAVLNVILAANPIGIVITAIAALIAAVILAYNNVGWFKDMVNAAWAGIQIAIGAVVNWFTGSVVPWFQDAFAAIGAVVTWLWENIFQPYFTFIFAIIQGVVNFVTGTLVPGIQRGFAVVGDVVNGAVRFFTGFRDNAIRAATGVLKWFQDLPGNIGNALAGAGQWLVQTGRDIINGLLGGIQEMIGNVGKTIADGLAGAVQGAKDFLGIKSPSTVFHAIGINTMQGYVDGVASMRRDVDSTVGNLLTVPDAPTINVGRLAPLAPFGAEGGRTPRDDRDVREIHLHFHGTSASPADLIREAGYQLQVMG